MGSGYRRVDLQNNALAKLEDAIILLEAQRFSNAYYLAGYSIEIALKACISVQFSADTIPDKSFVNKIYDHDLQALVKLAGLSSELSKTEAADNEFAANWAVVAQWSESTRYDSVDPILAQVFMSSISEPKSGVFQWIRNFW